VVPKGVSFGFDDVWITDSTLGGRRVRQGGGRPPAHAETHQRGL